MSEPSPSNAGELTLDVRAALARARSSPSLLLRQAWLRRAAYLIDAQRAAASAA